MGVLQSVLQLASTPTLPHTAISLKKLPVGIKKKFVGEHCPRVDMKVLERDCRFADSVIIAFLCNLPENSVIEKELPVEELNALLAFRFHEQHCRNVTINALAGDNDGNIVVIDYAQSGAYSPCNVDEQNMPVYLSQGQEDFTHIIHNSSGRMALPPNQQTKQTNHNKENQTKVEK